MTRDVCEVHFSVGEARVTEGSRGKKKRVDISMQHGHGGNIQNSKLRKKEKKEKGRGPIRARVQTQEGLIFSRL